MVSDDIKALFTSTLVEPVINIVQSRLQKDPLLPQRLSMSIPQIITLLEFCLKNTYFLFQGKYFKQIHVAAIGSPISTLIANLFMEEFKVKAISSASHSPHLLLRFVDDTFVIKQAEYCHQFLQHINFQDLHIKFTTEDPKEDDSVPFLDTLVFCSPNNTLQPHFTTNPPTQTNTYTGIAITSL